MLWLGGAWCRVKKDGKHLAIHVKGRKYGRQ